MFLLTIADFLRLFISNPPSTIYGLLIAHKYTAIFLLMVLEGSSLPVPSEVVIPLAGYLSAQGVMQLPIAFLAAAAGMTVGLLVDYSLGYYFGREVIYKHLRFFHIKKENLDRFDTWFSEHSVAALFISRLIPVVRTIMSFPAGFAKIPLRRFLLYSVSGTLIWDTVLILYGYYLRSVILSNQLHLIALAIGGFAIFIYAIYWYAMRKIPKK